MTVKASDNVTVKTLDPFSTLVSLTTYIKHTGGGEKANVTLKEI